MTAAAPGKLLLSGAYAVLEGAPAIVCAIDRRAYAFDGEGTATSEVRAALERPPAIDTAELEHEGKKLGLGSSAAALVAAMALRAGARGEDVEAPPTRRAIFEAARAIHARVQRGGSGVDVAASTFGGVLRYTIAAGAAPCELPAGIAITAFFSGTSARTSDLRARVEALRARDARTWEARMTELAAAAHAADDAVRAARASAFVGAVDASGPALAALGAAADAPIVPPAFAELGLAAKDEHAAFVPSGAGGGDVGVFVGTTAPSASFLQKAERAGMQRLALAIDFRGVHLVAENIRNTPS